MSFLTVYKIYTRNLRIHITAFLLSSDTIQGKTIRFGGALRKL